MIDLSIRNWTMSQTSHLVSFELIQLFQNIQN